MKRPNRQPASPCGDQPAHLQTAPQGTPVQCVKARKEPLTHEILEGDCGRRAARSTPSPEFFQNLIAQCRRGRVQNRAPTREPHNTSLSESFLAKGSTTPLLSSASRGRSLEITPTIALAAAIHVSGGITLLSAIVAGFDNFRRLFQGRETDSHPCVVGPNSQTGTAGKSACRLKTPTLSKQSGRMDQSMRHGLFVDT